MAMDAKQERSMATLCHVSALAGFIFPFGNIIGPIIMWMLNKKESALIEAEGKKSINFQISITIYVIVSILLCFILIGIPILIGLSIFNLVMIIVASVKTSNGEDFKYPLAIPFIK